MNSALPFPARAGPAQSILTGVVRHLSRSTLKGSSLRLAYIANSVIPSKAANSVQVVRMCEALGDLGHDVILFLPCREHRVGAAIEEICRFYGCDPVFRVRHLPWPSTVKPDVFWAMSTVDHAVADDVDAIFTRHPAAAYLAIMRSLPVIYEAHKMAGGRAPSKPWRPVRRLHAWINRTRVAINVSRLRMLERLPPYRSQRGAPGRQLLRRIARCDGFVSDRVFEARAAAADRTERLMVAITHQLADDLAARYPDLLGAVRVHPDGAKTPAPSVLPAALIPQAQGRLVVGYSGHLHTGKGMEIIGQLPHACPGLSFHIVGGREADVRRWRRETSGRSNIHFHGHVPPGDVSSYIEAFDICLLPNQARVATFDDTDADIGRHTSPLKMFEYMSAGKPIVASDLPVLREILSHEVNALLCRHDEPSQWVDALNRLQTDPSLRAKLGEHARQDVASHYTWQERARRIMADFTSIDAPVATESQKHRAS